MVLSFFTSSYSNLSDTITLTASVSLAICAYSTFVTFIITPSLSIARNTTLTVLMAKLSTGYGLGQIKPFP